MDIITTFFKSERLILKPLELDDLKVVQSWINNEDISFFNGSRLPVSMYEQKIWYERIINDANSKRLIIYNDENSVGLVSLHHIDFRNRKCEVGIYLHPDFQNNGFARESLNMVIQFAFCELNIRKIIAKIISFNVNSIKLFEKLGFKQEATLREEIFSNGKYFDLYVYSKFKN